MFWKKNFFIWKKNSWKSSPPPSNFWWWCLKKCFLPSSWPNKKWYTQRRRLRRINSLPKVKFSRLDWKRFSIFISFILSIDKSVCFSPFYEAKHLLFFQKKRKTLKINAPNSFFQNEPKFLQYIILDFFNKFLKTWSWTSWQKKSGDWT